jgi:hypothetical protein
MCKAIILLRNRIILYGRDAMKLFGITSIIDTSPKFTKYKWKEGESKLIYKPGILLLR